MEAPTYPNRKPPSRSLLTVKLMQALQPNESVADQTIVGLTARVSAGGRKAYTLRFQKEDGTDGRKTLGYFPDLTPDQARDRAKLLKNSLVFKSDDPVIRAAKIEQGLTAGGGKAATLTGTFIDEHYENYLVTETRAGKSRIQDLRHTFADLLNLPLAQITATRILQWRTKALASGLRSSTVNRKVDLLRGMLTRAVRWNFLARHPLKGFGKLEEPEGRERRLTAEERERLENVLRARDQAIRLARASGNAFRRARRVPEFPDLTLVAFADRLWPLVILTRETGLRWRECRNLRWVDVDFDHRQLVVRKANAKTKKRRHVPLTAIAWAALKGWREQTSGEWVFPNDESTGPIRSVRTAWRKVLRDADIQDFRWHDLRHDFASRAAESGASFHVVSRWLGHSSGTTTEGYIHYSPDFVAQNVALLDAQNALAPAVVATPPPVLPHAVVTPDEACAHPTR